MPRRTLQIRHFYFVRWTRIDVADVAPLLRDVVAAKAAAGRDLVYVALQGVEYREQSRDALAEFRRVFPELMEHVEVDHVVVLADGVTGTLQRSALRSVLTMGRTLRIRGMNKVRVSASLDEVWEHHPRMPLSPSEMEARLRTAGLLADPNEPPGSLPR